MSDVKLPDWLERWLTIAGAVFAICIAVLMAAVVILLVMEGMVWIWKGLV